MSNTFRSVSIDQSEAEAEVTPSKPPVPKSKSPGSGQEFTVAQVNSIVPPLEIYESIKGRPYMVDHLGLLDSWEFQKEEPERAVKVFGNVAKKVGAVEAYMHRYMKQNFMDDSPESTKLVLKILDKVARYSSGKDPLEKLDRIYSFVVSSNKSRALKSLRNALQRQSIDELVDTDLIRPSQLSPYMRK